MNPIISATELRALWRRAESVFPSTPLKQRYDVACRLAEELFPADRMPREIARRFYALLRCLDSSQSDLDKQKLGVYGTEQFAVSEAVILELWGYFGDTSREIDPRNVIRACEIV